MTDDRLWDRAAVAVVPRPIGRRARGRALPAGLPDRRAAVRLHARRRAPVRDAPDADPGAGRARRRGEEPTSSTCLLRHPGDAQGHDDPPGRGRRRPVRGLDLGRRRRPDLRRARTSSAPSDRSATARAASTTRDFPGTSKVYEPVTALPDGDPARHVRPSGRVLPERPRRPGRCASTGTDSRRRPRGDPARVRPPADDRGRRRPAGLPHRVAVDRETGRDPAPDRDDRRDRHPRCRRDRARPGRAAAAVRVRLRRSRPGRRCSTETDPSEASASSAYSRAIVRARGSRKGGPATDPARSAPRLRRPRPPPPIATRHDRTSPRSARRPDRVQPPTGSTRRAAKPDRRSPDGDRRSSEGGIR